MLEQADIVFAFLGGLLFAFMTARPGRPIGPRDERFTSRTRQAYFTYSIFVGLLTYGGLALLTRQYGFGMLLLVILPLIVVQGGLQAAYYIFLTAEEPESETG